MRLFVGIPLEAEVVEELSAVSMRLQSSEDGLRWSAPESWHITLQFLGNTPEYECIVARLKELLSPPLPVQLEDLGFFERAGVFLRRCQAHARIRGAAAARDYGNRTLWLCTGNSSLSPSHNAGAEQE